MTIDFDTPRSPGWWLKTLSRELHDRRLGLHHGRKYSTATIKPQRFRPGLQLLQDHLDGDPPLLSCASGWEDGYREIVRLGRLNVAALIVESKSNRMKLRDFRTAEAGDELGDEKARDIMRAANMVVVAREVHDGFLSLGDSYAIVTPPKDAAAMTGEDRFPIVTAEDAREVITAHDPATGKILAAFKMFRDEWDAADFAYLFVRAEALDGTGDDGSVRQWIATKPKGMSSITESAWRPSRAWDWVEGKEDMRVPKDRMPVHRFKNYQGVGEYERHLATLDRINDKIVDELTIAKTQAFRQRAVKNLPETEKKIVDGQVVEVDIDYTDVFEAAPGSLWQVPDGVEFWESAAIDLTPLRNAIKGDLEHLAAVTSTPLHVITPDAASGSAEGASLMRESSVDAAQTRIDHADRSWAGVMADCFVFMGDEERADTTQLEAIWGPVERYSLAEKASAASQAKTTLPDQAIQRDIWQYPPAEIPYLRTMKAADMMFQQPGQPPRPGTAPGAPPERARFDPGGARWRSRPRSKLSSKRGSTSTPRRRVP